MKLIFVAGSWGSGSTAVMSALNGLGVPMFGPHFQSNDPKTKNTFELIPFRKLILKYTNHSTLTHKENYHNEFQPALYKFRLQLQNLRWPQAEDNTKKTFALKMPLASICLPEICNTFETKIIVIHRPFSEIEASRIRRNWPRLYGSFGAEKIYSIIFKDVINHKLSFLAVSHNDLITSTPLTLEKMIEF